MKNSVTIVFVLLLAVALRGVDAFYAVGEVCLMPPAEYAFYTGDSFALAPALLGDSAYVLRWLGVLLGVISVALTLAIAQKLRVGQGVWAGAVVAVAPYFVHADRWLLASDGALLYLALGVWGLVIHRQHAHKRWAYGLFIAGTAGGLLFAPMLWWILIGLWFVGNAKGQDVAFALGMVALVVILARQPFAWLGQAGGWDAGVTASIAWLALLAFVALRRTLAPVLLRLAYGGVGVAFVLSAVSLWQLPRLNEEDWAIVRALQDSIADDSVVAFDRALAPLAPVVACPMGANIRMTWHTLGDFLPNDATSTAPNDTVQRAPVTNPALHAQAIASDVTLIRHISVPNALVLPFGEQVRLLGFELQPTTASAGNLLDLRLDWQFTSNLNEQASVYAGFIHVTLPNQPAEKVFEHTYPFIGEMSNVRPRAYQLNQHVRLIVPDLPAGAYDVIFGVYDTIERRELGRVFITTLIILPQG